MVLPLRLYGASTLQELAARDPGSPGSDPMALGGMTFAQRCSTYSLVVSRVGTICRICAHDSTELCASPESQYDLWSLQTEWRLYGDTRLISFVRRGIEQSAACYWCPVPGDAKASIM